MTSIPNLEKFIAHLGAFVQKIPLEGSRRHTLNPPKSSSDGVFSPILVPKCFAQVPRKTQNYALGKVNSDADVRNFLGM